MISPAQRSRRDWPGGIVDGGGAVERHIWGIDGEALRRDEMRRHAVAECGDSFGAASRQPMKFAPELPQRFSGPELRSAASTRNRLIHGRIDINPERLRLAASASVPSLRQVAQSALATLVQEDSP